MISAKGKGQRAFGCMFTYDPRNSLSDPWNEPRIPKFSNWRVELSSYIFELVVSVEFDNPTEAPELVHKTCVDQMYRAFINPNSVL